MEKTTVLKFKYGTSRGRDTYGHTIVTLYANGERVARTCGGGYDMRGTCLGQYIKKNYLERLLQTGDTEFEAYNVEGTDDGAEGYFNPINK